MSRLATGPECSPWIDEACTLNHFLDKITARVWLRKNDVHFALLMQRKQVTCTVVATISPSPEQHDNSERTTPVFAPPPPRCNRIKTGTHRPDTSHSLDGFGRVGETCSHPPSKFFGSYIPPIYLATETFGPWPVSGRQTETEGKVAASQPVALRRMRDGPALLR